MPAISSLWDSAAPANPFQQASSPLHYFLTGSNVNTSLYLLAFDTAARTLNLTQTIPGYAPHQFLNTNPNSSVVYATSINTPQLFSWTIGENYEFSFLNQVNTSAVAVWASVNDDGYLYSAGGPVAEVWTIEDDGAIGEPVSEMEFLASGSNRLAVDRSRGALTTGAHSFDAGQAGKAFVPHLSNNAIYMYDVLDNGTAILLDEVKNPSNITTDHGYRNSWPSEDGRLLYVVTEETCYLDVFEVQNSTLSYVQTASTIPSTAREQYQFRGNTVRQSRDGKYLFTSVRGNNGTLAHGYVGAFRLDSQGHLDNNGSAVAFFEAESSLGISAGLRPVTWSDESEQQEDGGGIQDYMSLTDGQEGKVYILGWTPSNETFSVVAEYQFQGGILPFEGVWLS